MYPRLFKLPKENSFFLFGPRGTGKTTCLRSLMPDAAYIDLLDDTTYREYLSLPSLLDQRLKDHPPKRWVVIDEIQRVPALLNQVHRLIEARKLKFALTGSSARKLKSRSAKDVNLLAGRALSRSFFPLTAEELGKDFDLKKALQTGHLPSIFGHVDPADYLQSYVVTYLREEVQQEGLVRNLAGFSRFMEAASLAQAQVLNVSSVSRDCQVERKVAENYFSILEDLLIAFRLPVFSKKAKRKLLTHQKFFYFDVGVYRTIRPKGPLDTDADIDGAALETLVTQEVRAINSYHSLGYSLFYWRTADHRFEVDLVCYGERGLKAFEVKRSSRLREEDFAGLREFGKDYPMAQLFLLYGGTERVRHGSIEVIPVTEAVPSLREMLG